MTRAAGVVHGFGETALLVDLPDLAAVRSLHRALADDVPRGVVDVVPAARTVLVRCAAPPDVARARAWVQEALLRASSGDGRPGAGAVVEIPVRYDGPDLDDVARWAGVSVEEVVARHAGREYEAAFGGFAPGFTYLAGVDPVIAAPRLSTPRTRVPAGSVALAGELTAVYPGESPGGWRLLGRTDVRMFDVDRDPPALVAPGARVRFVPSRSVVSAASARERGAGPGGAGQDGADQGDARRSDVGQDGADQDDARRSGVGQDDARWGGPSRAATPGEHPAGSPAGAPARGPSASAGQHRGVAEPGSGGRHAVEVLATGPLVLVEDVGRPGLAAIGVGPSGAADRASHALANRLVGNPANAATLEVALGGLALRFHGRAVVALAGAVVRATVDGVSVGMNAPVPVPGGGVLRLGLAERGLRTYVAVRGGVAPDPVLGSRSYDTLSGIGPAPLRPGDVLAVGEPQAGTWPPVEVAPVRHVPGVPRPGERAGAVLEVVPAPRADWFLPGAWQALRALRTVSADSDRVAIRLDGQAVPRRAGELPSEGLVRGAVQIPPDGRPVVFLADRPVTGGYPVIGVLRADDVDRAAQLRPGDRVVLRRARPS